MESPADRGEEPAGSPARPLRVLFFSPSWPPAAASNGIVSYIGNLRPALQRAGVRSVVVAGHCADDVSDPEVVDLARTPRSNVVADLVDRALCRVQPARSGVRHATRHMADVIRSVEQAQGVDLVEIEESFGAAEQLVRRLRTPVVVRLHGPWFLTGAALGVPQDGSFAWRVRQEGRGIARAAAVTSPSRATLDQVRAQYRLPLATAEVVPNGGPEVSDEECWTLGRCDPDLLLFVGRFDRHKGGDLALAAFREIAAARPSVRLAFVGPDRGLIGGDGTAIGLPAFLERAVPEAAIRARIEVTGPLPAPAVAALRRRAYLTIVPSRYESFSMTVLEALAHGCPVVAADAGGIPELVRDGDNGRLFRAGDARHLASILRSLLSDRAAAERMARAARTDYLARFAPEVVARQMASFYRRVVARHRVAG